MTPEDGPPPAGDEPKYAPVHAVRGPGCGGVLLFHGAPDVESEYSVVDEFQVSDGDVPRFETVAAAQTMAARQTRLMDNRFIVIQDFQMDIMPPFPQGLPRRQFLQKVLREATRLDSRRLKSAARYKKARRAVLSFPHDLLWVLRSFQSLSLQDLETRPCAQVSGCT